jgi:hypothetical protein
MDAAAALLGVTMVRIRVHDTAEIEPAISAFAAAPHGGLVVAGVPPVPFYTRLSGSHCITACT